MLSNDKLCPCVEAQIQRNFEIQKRDDLVSQRDRKSSMRYMNSSSGNLYSMNDRSLSIEQTLEYKTEW